MQWPLKACEHIEYTGTCFEICHTYMVVEKARSLGLVRNVKCSSYLFDVADLGKTSDITLIMPERGVVTTAI